MAFTQPFRFLDLPAELRNEIYRFTFADSTTTFARWPPNNSGTETITHATSADENTEGYPSILCANKQIHAEARPVFYTTTKMEATEMEILFKTLEKLDVKTRASIERVTLSYIFPVFLRFPVAYFRSCVEQVPEDWAKLGGTEVLGFDASKIVYEAWCGFGGVRDEPLEKLLPREVGVDEDVEAEMASWCATISNSLSTRASEQY